MDPFVQSALMALGAGLAVVLIVRFVVPLLPGDGREAERLEAMRREREAHESAARPAE